MDIKHAMVLFSLCFILESCGKTPPADSHISNRLQKEKYHRVKTYSYDSLTIPAFFKELISNHTNDFSLIINKDFIDFCDEYALNLNDSSNIRCYYTLKILHDLFTSQTAANCSSGDILHIPYFWHWVDPNPRYEIYFTANQRLLKDSRPPKEFSKYNSYADIDRTPFIFLSDLVGEEPGYYSASCDTFATFGWCSEREMAFVCLTELLGFNGKVVAENNHSWSEFIVSMITDKSESTALLVNIDNTFNVFEWASIDGKTIQKWNTYLGKSKLAGWYNQKTHSQAEKDKIGQYRVSPKAAMRIEKKVVEYLNKAINK